jgi:hypothetical protein
MRAALGYASALVGSACVFTACFLGLDGFSGGSPTSTQPGPGTQTDAASDATSTEAGTTPDGGLITLPPCTDAANTIIVDGAGGSDASGNGSGQAPYRSIARALTAARLAAAP